MSRDEGLIIRGWLALRDPGMLLEESPVTSHAKTLLRGFVLMFRRFTILIKLSSGTNLVKSIVAREK